MEAISFPASGRSAATWCNDAGTHRENNDQTRATRGQRPQSYQPRATPWEKQRIFMEGTSRGAAPDDSPRRKSWVKRITCRKPRQGRQKIRVCRPSGANHCERRRPTARAVGYDLAPLRGSGTTCRTPAARASSFPAHADRQDACPTPQARCLCYLACVRGPNRN